MRTPSRSLPALVALLVLALVASACGGGGTTTAATEDDAGAPTAGAPADAFPVTIDHIWGSATIERTPQRVVSLGVTDADVALALGVTPVALTGFLFFETRLGPWATPLVEGDQPEVLNGEPNIEHIASRQPDLIIAVSAGFEEPVYQLLSAIAPTIVRPAGTAAFQVPRDDATRMISAALGQPERGEQLVAEADARYEQAVAAHPEFRGKTGVVVLPYDGKYGAYTPRDARGQVMSQLGFELPPALAALDSEGSFFIEISQEQVSLLDADVLVMLADAPAPKEFVDNDAVLQQVPVVRDGRMVILDTNARGAITYNSVLSVPYALDQLVPKLSSALTNT